MNGVDPLPSGDDVRGHAAVKIDSGEARLNVVLENPGGSENLQVAGLWALLSLDDVKLHLGALVEDGSADVIGMDEYIFPAAVGSDESKALVCIEKLNRTCLHLARNRP